MHALRKDRRGAVVQATVVAIIAVVGAATVLGQKNDVQHSGINMITEAAVDRAGATALPTEPTAQPTRPMQRQ